MTEVIWKEMGAKGEGLGVSRADLASGRRCMKSLGSLEQGIKLYFDRSTVSSKLLPTLVAFGFDCSLVVSML